MANMFNCNALICTEMLVPAGMSWLTKLHVFKQQCEANRYQPL